MYHGNGPEKLQRKALHMLYTIPTVEAAGLGLRRGLW